MPTAAKKHYVDYIWMAPPDGGKPVKIDLKPDDPHQVAALMNQGFTQVEEPKEK